MTGPTAASTPAKPQRRGSRIPVRHQLQEPHPSHKANQPIIDSRSVQSASIGYSSPRVPSSVGGASEHRSALLHHPTTVMQQLPTEHHPTRVTVTQPSGLIVTQQHHPMESNTMMKTQHHPTMTQYPHPMGVTVSQQLHPKGVTMTQVNATQANSAICDDNKMNYDTFDDENSLNLTTGVMSCVVLFVMLLYAY